MQLISAYTNYKDPLGPGVAIQRKGAVRDFFVQKGSISFEIHDKRERAFDVEIHTTPPSENVRRAALSGDLHEAVPKVAEIQIHHVCPDWATPCRHEIAALLQLLKECEDDPNVILKWRGIEVESESVDEEAPIKNDNEITSRKSTIQQLRDTMPGRFINLNEEKSNESVLSPDMELFFLSLRNTSQHQDVLQYIQSAKRCMLRQRYKLMDKISTQSLKMQSKRLKNFLVRTKILTSGGKAPQRPVLVSTLKV